MDFFKRHMPASESAESSPITTFVKPTSKYQSQITVTSLPPSKDVRPLAISTPLRSSANCINAHSVKEVAESFCKPPPRTHGSESANLTKKKAVVTVPEQTSGQTRTLSTKDKIDVSTTDSTQQDSTTESRMKSLYESLQAEAEKIQQFKVHAMSQINQKSEEIALRESQIKNLGVELSAARAENASLETKLQRLKHSNEDIMSKVATTREMCFSLAEEHLSMKEMLKFGKNLFQEVQQKYEDHSLCVKKAVGVVDGYKATTNERLAILGQSVEAKQVALDKMVKKHAGEKECLQQQIDEKTAFSEHLEKQLTESSNTLIKTRDALELKEKQSVEKETELTAAMEALNLSKNDEICSLQGKLADTISSNAKSTQELVTMIEDTREELRACQTNLQSISADLESEVSRCQQVTDEKAACDEKVKELELKIEELVLVKDEQGEAIEKYKESVNDYSNKLDQAKLDIAALENSMAEVKCQLEEDIKSRVKEIDELTALEKDLREKLETLDLEHHQLQEKYTSLEKEKISVADTLEHVEGELSARTAELESSRSELLKLKEMLEETSANASNNQSALKELMDKLKEDHRVQKASDNEIIADLKMDLQTARDKIVELKDQHQRAEARNEEALTSVKESMKSQKLHYEGIIEEKETAFTKTQDEMQGLFDAAAITSKQQLADLQAAMKEQMDELELEMKQKNETFMKVQAEQQTILEETEKKLEQEYQKVEDLTQDLTITKGSLDKSLQEKNVVVAALAQKTQELQDISNKLLVKDCEFNKLMNAVQNLKSRWAAAATPMTPAATPPPLQQAAIRPTSHTDTSLNIADKSFPSTPIKPSTPKSISALPATPITRTDVHAGNITPKANSTPKAAKASPFLSTPQTPPNSNMSMNNPKGILRNEGSASKSNRVVFRTPVEQKNAIQRSESDTSVLDMKVVNMLTPSKAAVHGIRQANNIPQAASRSHVKVAPVTASNDSLSNTLSPAMSSQSTGERLPRSKMLKAANNRKRLRSVGKKDDLGLLSKTMKRHKLLMERSKKYAPAIRESDSDCFGFGSE